VANDTVTIIFKATGEKELLEALKGLSNAEKALVDQTVKAAKKIDSTKNQLAIAERDRISRQNTDDTKRLAKQQSNDKLLSVSHQQTINQMNAADAARVAKITKDDKKATADRIRIKKLLAIAHKQTDAEMNAADGERLASINKLKAQEKKAANETFRLKKKIEGYSSASLLGAKSTRILGGSIAVLRSKLLIASFAFVQLNQVFGKFVTISGDAEEINDKFNIVFGNSAESVSQWTEVVGASLGFAEQTLKEFLSSFQDTFVPLGFAREDAATLSKVLTQLGIDVASFSNKLDTDVMRDFQSAIVGNTETVKKYGIIIRANDLAQKAFELGITNSVRELNEQEKALVRVRVIINSSKDALGNKRTTLNSYNNSVKVLGEQWKSTSKAMGDGLKEVAKPLLFLTSHLTNTEVLKGYATSIGTITIAYALYKRQAILASIATMNFSKALTRTGIGIIAIALGELASNFIFADDTANNLTVGLDDLSKELDSIKVGATEVKEAFDNWALIGTDLVNIAERGAIALLRLNDATAREIELAKNNIERKKKLAEVTNDLVGASDEEKLELEQLQKDYEAFFIIMDDVINKKHDERSSTNDLTQAQKDQLEVMKRVLKLYGMTDEAKRMAIEGDIALVLANAKLFGSFENVVDIIQKLNDQMANIGGGDDQVIEPLLTGIEAFSLGLGQANDLVSALGNNVQANMRNDIAALKKTDAYRNASSERRKTMEDDVVSSHAKAQQRIARLEKASSIAQAVINTHEAYTNALTAGPIAGPILATIIAGLGAAQVAAMISTPIPQFAEGGSVGGRRHSQGGTLIEAEQGEFILSRDAVASIGLETVNRLNQGQQASSGITVNGDIYGFDDFRDKVLQANKVNGMGLA